MVLLAPLRLDYNNSYRWNNDEMVDVWIGNEWFKQSEKQTMKDHYAAFSYENRKRVESHHFEFQHLLPI